MLTLNEPSWQNVLKDEFEKPYFSKLTAFVEMAYSQSRCYPSFEHIFNAFTLCPFDQVKVVILGQDPYHGFGQAHGLSFSVQDGIPLPPSLINIFKELEADCGIPIAITGNLERWAKQGVLLLNATLTVAEQQAGSHQKKGWEEFTDTIIEKLAREKKHLVFVLWGAFAQKKGAKIDKNKHLVLTSGHPSPLSANRGLWFGNRHFSQINAYLETHKIPKIEW